MFLPSFCSHRLIALYRVPTSTSLTHPNHLTRRLAAVVLEVGHFKSLASQDQCPGLRVFPIPVQRCIYTRVRAKEGQAIFYPDTVGPNLLNLVCDPCHTFPDGPPLCHRIRFSDYIQRLGRIQAACGL